MSNEILDRLMEEVSRAKLTQGGAVTFNTNLLAQGFRNRLARGGIPFREQIDAEFMGFPDDMTPRRNMMRVPRQPMGNIGIHAWPFPGTSMPNVHGGRFDEPQRPSEPEYYVPGFTNQWLRGT